MNETMHDINIDTNNNFLLTYPVVLLNAPLFIAFGVGNIKP